MTEEPTPIRRQPIRASLPDQPEQDLGDGTFVVAKRPQPPEVIFKITPDGHVIPGPGLQWDAAAEAFIDAMASTGRKIVARSAIVLTDAKLEKLRAEVNPDWFQWFLNFLAEMEGDAS